MPTTAYDAMLRRCPRAIVGPPDDDTLGQTISGQVFSYVQPFLAVTAAILKHYTPKVEVHVAWRISYQANLSIL